MTPEAVTQAAQDEQDCECNRLWLSKKEHLWVNLAVAARRLAPKFYFKQVGAEFEIGLRVEGWWWERTSSKFASGPFVSTENRCNPIIGEVELTLANALCGA